MFFLWGILIATPIVAGTILAVIWFGQLLIAPLASGDVHRIPWNRPSLFLGLITTSISAVVAGYSLGNALYDWGIPDFLFVVMNVSAAFLVTNVGGGDRMSHPACGDCDEFAGVCGHPGRGRSDDLVRDLWQHVLANPAMGALVN